MGRITRYRALPDQAYDVRVTDLSKPFNVPAGSGPQSAYTEGPGLTQGVTNPNAQGWINRNRTNTIPLQLVANAASIRALPYNPKRTGLIFQNKDLTASLFYSFGNQADSNSLQISPGGYILLDFTCPPDELYLFATANIQVTVAEISRTGSG